ncbi:MAG: hypothetical protein ABH848_03840 [Candidatus Omnitrophota bacterium]
MVKKILVVVISLLVIGGSVHRLIEFRQDEKRGLPYVRSWSALGKVTGFISSIKDNIRDAILEKRYKDNKLEKIAIHFKDGSMIIGELISKTEDEYRIMYKDEETIVFAGLVERIGDPEEALREKDTLSNKEISEHWPYEHSVVIRLKNTNILDAKIINVTDDRLTLLYGGEEEARFEQEIERDQLENIIFKPVDNEETRKVRRNLEELFSKMEFYTEGNFTIVTDSYATWVKECKGTLRRTYTDIYLEFFDVFKDREPMMQNFVVIFDDYSDFIEYAVSDGVPGWAVMGYFDPQQRVLYMYNILGDRFSEFMFEAWVGETGRTIDDIVEDVQGMVDKRYHIFIEGMAKKIKDKFWEAYSYYRNMFRDSTMSVLRHEFAHEVFHNWGIQSVIVSKFKGETSDLVRRKKEFLETKDPKKKARLFKTLMTQSNQDVPIDMRAANSWLAEGTATYCQTSALGEQDDMLLYTFQEMLRKGPAYPIEFLTNYKLGSFPGVYSGIMLDMYAQSWAFVNFLMDNYKDEFVKYQNKLAEVKTEESEDVEWLFEILGKDSKTLQKEFLAYMDDYEEIEDPNIERFVNIYNIFQKY